MNRKSNIQLRNRDKNLPDRKRYRSLSVPKKDRAYEREQKKKIQREIKGW